MTPEQKPPVEAFNEWAVARSWPAHCDPTLAFESPALLELLAIWREQAGGDPAPHRSRLTARLLRPHLGIITIIERAAEVSPRYRVRLLGTRLALVLGEMQGRFLDDVMAPEVVPQWEARLDLTLAEGHPLRFLSRVDMKQLYHLRSETLWAPLAGDENPLVFMAAVLSFNTVMPAEHADTLSRIA